MDKTLTFHLVVEKEGRKYSFIAPAGSPIGEAHDALYEFLQEIVSMANEAVKKVEPQAKEEQPQS